MFGMKIMKEKKYLVDVNSKNLLFRLVTDF